MEPFHTMMRQRMPESPCTCALPRPCVYRVDGACDMPGVNRGNSDAACHRITPRAMLPVLEYISQENT